MLALRLFSPLRRRAPDGTPFQLPFSSRIRSFASKRRVFDNEISSISEKVTVVETASDAALVVQKLITLDPGAVVAWNTRTVKAGANASQEGISIGSAYAGSDVDFGSGPHLFVRGYDDGERRKIWDVFRGYFEDEECTKIWFDYSSTRSGLLDHGIVPRGLFGDIVRMACLTGTETDKHTTQAYADCFLSLTARENVHRWSNIVGSSQSEPHACRFHDQHLLHQRNAEGAWRTSFHVDAILTYLLYEELRQKLIAMEIQGVNSTLEFQTKFTNLFDVYMSYHIPLVKQIYEMQIVGAAVDSDLLQTDSARRKEHRRMHEDKFRSWASEFSPDAAFMDIYCQKQLRHLLFAPCENVHVKTRSLPREERFTVLDDRDSRHKGVRLKTKPSIPKRDIVLRGSGAQASIYTPQGWPSTSSRALRKAAESPNEKRFCSAVYDLLKAKALRDVEITTSVHNAIQLCSKNRIYQPYDVDMLTGRPKLNCDDNLVRTLRQSLCARPGHRLIAADYSSLELRLLGHLSQCESLIGRLEQGGNVHEIAAVGLFENVEDAVNNGSCDVQGAGLCTSSAGVMETRAQGTVATQFVSEYLDARVLDELLGCGSPKQKVVRGLSVATERAQELIEKWRDLHPGVQDWQKRCVGFGEVNHFVETMLGRRMKASKLKSKRGTEKQKAVFAALNFILKGSCGDAMGGAMVKLGRNETLSALEWQVVFVDGNTIVLEGPSYALDVAVPLVQEVMAAPFPFALDVTLKTNVAYGESLQALQAWDRRPDETLALSQLLRGY